MKKYFFDGNLLGIIAIIAIFPASSSAQEAIVTDRPDFTESNRLVPKGKLQLESGFTFTNQRLGMHLLALPETLLRFGAANGVEGRVGLPGFERTTGGKAARISGFGDAYLGLKLPLPALRNGTELALIPALFVPAGKAGIQSEATQPEIKLVWAQSLADERSLSGMLYLLVPQEEGKRQRRIQHTISYGLPLAKGYALFTEAVTDLGENILPAYQLHSGVTFQPDSNSQWDIHFGVGLNRQAPHSFLAAGYSVRFGGTR